MNGIIIKERDNADRERRGENVERKNRTERGEKKGVAIRKRQ